MRVRPLAIGYRLPRLLSVPLFGDRARYGKAVDRSDPCWREWSDRVYWHFYENSQRSGGGYVNAAGYRIMSEVALDGLAVLEMGPGSLDHVRHWRGTPARYVALDVRADLMKLALERLTARECDVEPVLGEDGLASLRGLSAGSVDMVVSFFNLEHLHPLADYVAELVRVLRPGGRLVGAIPAEGGLAWGCGRFLTTRRWLKRNSTVDPDKIICWEHPNFADDIIAVLDRNLVRERLDFWPISLPVIDPNLVVRFVYKKSIPGSTGGHG